MPTDPKHVWMPPDRPLTPDERKMIAAHERLHAEYAPNMLPEEKALRLKQIEQFEAGSPFVHPVPNWADLIAGSGQYLAADISAPAAKPLAAKKYFVHWGYTQRNTDEFTDFQRALDHFVDHKGSAPGARLVGEGYDADCDEDGFHEVSDGLTDDERERVEAAS